MNEQERPLTPAQEHELEAELVRLRAAMAPQDDALAANVAALRRLDTTSEAVVERMLDTSLECYASSTASVGPLDFFVARLRLSPALRLVAASLVAHVLVLPVLAYQVLVPQKAEPTYRIEFMLPSDQPPVPDSQDDLHLLDAESVLGESSPSGDQDLPGADGPGGGR